MIIGSHVIVYSRDEAADRAFLRDVLKLPHVDAGGGRLIFGLRRRRWLFITPTVHRAMLCT
jgi:hypothetical protein